MSRPMTLDEIDQDASDFYGGLAAQALLDGAEEMQDYFLAAFFFYARQITERRQAALAKENRDDH